MVIQFVVQIDLCFNIRGDCIDSTLNHLRTVDGYSSSLRCRAAFSQVRNELIIQLHVYSLSTYCMGYARLNSVGKFMHIMCVCTCVHALCICTVHNSACVHVHVVLISISDYRHLGSTLRSTQLAAQPSLCKNNVAPSARGLTCPCFLNDLSFYLQAVCQP